jgi:hypothetical protein
MLFRILFSASASLSNMIIAFEAHRLLPDAGYFVVPNMVAICRLEGASKCSMETEGRQMHTLQISSLPGTRSGCDHASSGQANRGDGVKRHVIWRIIPYLAVALLYALSAHAQISPGPLARAHRALNGPSNCIKCHEVSTRSPNFRCLECHREIASELQQHRGLHATFPQAGPAGAACVKCHSDHNGENFALLHWDPAPNGFDHSKTGYLLDGKHAGVGCRSCHNAKFVAPSQRILLANKDLNSTWMGLSSRCIACHEDRHQGRFGAECTQCHSTSDWKNAKIDRLGFDHSKTRYPLTGAHMSTPCAKCHVLDVDNQPRYTGIPFSTCVSCHTDPHKGEFTQGCESCHSTSTWRKSSFVSTFDHSKTNYPLLGKHLDVPCLTCHKSANFKTPMAYANCADCHKSDPHGGQFLKRSDGGRCESCHTVQGWSPSTYTAADHAKTGFPLTPPHAKEQCADCHIPAGKNTRYRIKFALCVDCHKDEHEGQFAAQPWSNRCEQCHNGLTFKTSNYTLLKHQTSSFPLTGGHEAVACNDCHKPLAGYKVALYHFSALACTSCHEDIHKGQFARRMAFVDTQGKPLGCLACHSTNEWKDLTKFDHAQTSFPLIGSHRAVLCTDCHKPPNMELTMEHVDFTGAPTQCSLCHQNPHADQFGVKANDCASCHSSNKWRPSLFDHEKTVFSLKGGHQDVACSACHILKRPVDGNLVLFYKPTPTSCEACHGSNVPKPLLKNTSSSTGL